MNSLPRVLIIGLEEDIKLHSNQLESYEANELCVLTSKDDLDIERIINTFNPDSIITIGDSYHNFHNLNKKSLDIRRRWVHLENAVPNLGEIAYQCASNYILNFDYQDIPLVSFFTPICNTGEKLLRTFESVKNQSYTNWEWVIVNDCSYTDADNTLTIAESIADQDSRVQIYDFRNKSGGIVGEAKYRAASLCKGTYLLELDHDDYLLPNAAYFMVLAFKNHPDCKFVYSDFAEIYENHHSIVYGKDFAFGYGSYREERYNGLTYQVVNTPNINPKTIRHIVGVPNHFRAWDRVFYHTIGGHNRRLTIADDYELIVRTFLKTKMVRIPELLYLQFYHDTNTQNITRADIQRRVRSIRNYYNEKIRDRFIELGYSDWAYDFNKLDPLSCPSKFGKEENAVNDTFTHNTKNS